MSSCFGSRPKVGTVLIIEVTLGQAESFGEIAGGPLLGLVATLRTVRVALVGAAAVLLPAFPLYALALRRDTERPTPAAR